MARRAGCFVVYAVTSFLEIWPGILRTCDGYFDRRETIDETIGGKEMRVLAVEYKVSSSRKIVKQD